MTPDRAIDHVRVELLSDLCHAGGGRGLLDDADTVTELDPLGLPRLGGRALRGLLLDAAQLAVPALGPDWTGLALALLGRPGTDEGALWVGDARVGAADRQAAAWGRSRDADLPRLLARATTVIRRQTAIDDGVAKEGALRSSRLARRGLVLEAPLRLDGLPDGEVARARALLAGLCSLVRRAGLHRTRGWGRVRATLQPDDGAFAAFQAALAGKPVPARPSAQPAAPRSAGRAATRIAFRVTLDAPALFPVGDADPNTVDTWTRIPGSALLGAMAARHLERRPLADPARDDRFRALFLDGRVRWQHAYPEASGQVRLLPAPLSLRMPKDQPERRIDLADLGFTPGPEDDLRDARLGYVELPDDGEVVRHRTPATTDELHHVRDRERGRPIDGGLFHYRAIAAGERFLAAVELDDPALADEVRALLEGGPVLLGRSKAAEYGGDARIEVLDRARPEFVPQGADPAHLVVTLLSEYVAPDGEEPRAALLTELRRELGGALGAGEPKREFLRQRAIRGYAAHWRAHRAAAPALAAGSVLVFDTPGDEVAGRVLVLGERVAEGYGRVALGWHGVAAELACGAPLDPPAGRLDDPGGAASLRAAALERAILDRLDDWIDALGIEGAEKVSPATLAALRRSEVGALGAEQRRRLGGVRATGAAGRRGLVDLLESWEQDPSTLVDLLTAEKHPAFVRGADLSAGVRRRLVVEVRERIAERARRDAQRGGAA